LVPLSGYAAARICVPPMSTVMKVAMRAIIADRCRSSRRSRGPAPGLRLASETGWNQFDAPPEGDIFTD
jgi:hypothetical protein